MSDLFAAENRPVTLEDMRRCIQRELAQRKRVYPRLIASGRMPLEQAEREMDVMRAVLQLIEKQPPPETARNRR